MSSYANQCSNTQEGEETSPIEEICDDVETRKQCLCDMDCCGDYQCDRSRHVCAYRRSGYGSLEILLDSEDMNIVLAVLMAVMFNCCVIVCACWITGKGQVQIYKKVAIEGEYDSDLTDIEEAI